MFEGFGDHERMVKLSSASLGTVSEENIDLEEIDENEKSVPSITKPKLS